MFAINRQPANDLLFFYDSYIRKLSHRLLASQIRHGNNGDLWCHAARRGYVTILFLMAPLLTVHMKRINLIKMFFPSIHPPYISWFYLNQSNFFQGLFSQLNVSSKKYNKKKKGPKWSPVLPHASYSPVDLYHPRALNILSIYSKLRAPLF